MVFCDFLVAAEDFSGDGGGFLRGGDEGFLYDHSGFRPVRERSCYPGVLPCASPEAGGSGGVEAGFPRQWPGCRVRLEFQRGHNGGRAEFSVSLGHDGRPRRTIYAVCSWPTRTARPRRSHRPRPERRLEGAPLTEPDGIRSGSPGQEVTGPWFGESRGGFGGGF